MPKELGQIHTVNYEITSGAPGAINEVTNVDLPAELTKQLQRNIRCGNYFKVVGVDIGIDTTGTTGGGQISGRLEYFAPTKGRCEAFRGAWESMKDMLRLQGIDWWDNAMYDFRVPMGLSTNEGFENQATLNGVGGLYLHDTSNTGTSVFDIHNQQVLPTTNDTATGDLFRSGFDTLIQDHLTGTDFVLNDTALWSGNTNEASTTREKIPFNISWTPDSTDMAVMFQWKPDPALYLAVLCGQFQLVIEELELDGGNEQGLNMRLAVHVSGWKSIMGDPLKRKSKRLTGKRKSHGRKHRK